MHKLQNTLYITTQGSYLHKDGGAGAQEGGAVAGTCDWAYFLFRQCVGVAIFDGILRRKQCEFGVFYRKRAVFGAFAVAAKW